MNMQDMESAFQSAWVRHQRFVEEFEKQLGKSEAIRLMRMAMMNLTPEQHAMLEQRMGKETHERIMQKLNMPAMTGKGEYNNASKR